MGSTPSLPTFPSLLTAPNAPFIHRDLSWLQFNERVLAEAHLQTNPLFERIKFLAISSTNLDEFFMIRFPSMVRSIQRSSAIDRHATLRLLRIRNDILEGVQKFTLKQDQILRLLKQELSMIPIHMGLESASDRSQWPSHLAKDIFDEEILPKISPPEPFTPSRLDKLENLQMAVLFGNDLWFRIPRNLPTLFCKWNKTPSEFYCFFLEEVLTAGLKQTFGLEQNPVFLRLTRDGDFKVDLEEEDSESIPDIVRSGLGNREKGRPSRLQYLGNPNRDLMNQILKALRLNPAQSIQTSSTLNLHGINLIKSHTPESLILSEKLCFAPLSSIIPKPCKKADQIFERLDREDILLHHPYDSFDAYVSWIRAACEDKNVTQIEQTVYRMDTLSPVIELLKNAAQNKTIRVVIELRARFDELNNLRLADELRKAGVQVSFGFGKLKLHGKVALVTRVINEQPHYYAHLSTGNYNATTARLYTDLSILTSHPQICADIRYFFDRICAGQIPNEFKCIVPAPAKLHRRLISHIQAETQAAEQGKKAQIFAKVNALVDDVVVQHLYRASQAGVKVDLIVRGACSLVPGVKGLSENIRVISIVDRFLEHSRIYYFGHAQVIYLSSADWMPRNFFSRLELAFPILDPHIYRYIKEFVIPVYLADTVKAKQLTPEGKWQAIEPSSIIQDTEISPLLKNPDKPVRSQFFFEEVALKEYVGTPLWRKIYGESQ